MHHHEPVGSPVTVSNSRKRILVIEDDRTAGALYRQVLELDGFDVDYAANGREGLETIAANRPDLVVLDILMPVMGGWEFLDRLRELGDPMPVVVASASAEASRALAHGAVACYLKTSPLAELRELCRVLLSE